MMVKQMRWSGLSVRPSVSTVADCRRVTCRPAPQAPAAAAAVPPLRHHQAYQLPLLLWRPPAAWQWPASSALGSAGCASGPAAGAAAALPPQLPPSVQTSAQTALHLAWLLPQLLAWRWAGLLPHLLCPLLLASASWLPAVALRAMPQARAQLPAGAGQQRSLPPAVAAGAAATAETSCLPPQLQLPLPLE